MQSRLDALGVKDYAPAKCPVAFWDVFGEQGHPVRATISDMGPVLLARLLNLNDTQAGVLQLVFRIADDNGLLLLDLKDLRAMMQYVGENAKSFSSEYGNVSAASIGAIQRGLLNLGEQGGEVFFGEPMLDIADLMQTDDGRGVVNILAADKLMASPRLYSTFLLWLLAELVRATARSRRRRKPKLVFFFDEAHLLFSEAPAALLEKIEQVVRLIRSKGVGVYFVTQNPLDIPDTVLGQLGNRVQHALRAFTPRDQKAVRAAAQTLRANPRFDAETAITELGVGEALVSFLDEQGPAKRRRARLRPAAGVADGAADCRGAAGSDQGFDDLRPLREGGRSRVGLRVAQGSAGPDPQAGGTQPRPASRSQTLPSGGWLGGLATSSAAVQAAGAHAAAIRSPPRPPRARRGRLARKSAISSFAACWVRCSAAVRAGAERRSA
jgi:hypothetical protein